MSSAYQQPASYTGMMSPAATAAPTSIFTSMGEGHTQVEVLQYVSGNAEPEDIMRAKAALEEQLGGAVARYMREGNAVAVRVGYVEVEDKGHIIPGAMLLRQRAMVSPLRNEAGEPLMENRAW